ncbi:uncharacterized protein LOC133924119 [Phragmites australis]|uniref:uncharacterized protein LOC133924119 n=1 Tax=Phragmites australis TaxID=29695 RepID=UPI002D78ED22|nr:uncharacterized protein LOC133924119 [Phragmites australis]
MVLQNDIDLLNPPAELEKLKHKKKRLVQSPNSFFMHYRVQPLSDCRGLPGLPDGALPAYWWEGQANRGVLLPPQGRLRDENHLKAKLY